MGALLGFAGAAALFAGKIGSAGGSLSRDAAFGYLLALGCAFVWSSYSVLSRRLKAAPTEAVAGFCLATAALAALCHFLFEPYELAKADFDPSDTVEFWDLVNRQDWSICESVQQGISARVHERGYYAPMEDFNLDIRRYVLDRIGDAVKEA